MKSVQDPAWEPVCGGGERGRGQVLPPLRPPGRDGADRRGEGKEGRGGVGGQSRLCLPTGW